MSLDGYQPPRYSVALADMKFTQEELEISAELHDDLMDSIDAQLACRMGFLPPIPSRRMRREIRKKLSEEKADALLAVLDSEF